MKIYLQTYLQIYFVVN